MTESLIASLAWPAVAWFAICAAISGMALWHHPTQARSRLDALQALAEAQAAALAELRSRINALESQSAPEFGTADLVRRLREGGR